MKNVVLGVTGSIAAYKACNIVSKLKKNAEINVDVIMTKSAQKLVAPATFQTLSKNPVNTEVFQEYNYAEVNHIALAKKADIFVVAPATANIIAKLANGICDDMLTTVALATKAPIVIAPAMNTVMFENTATQENLDTLRKRGAVIIEPDCGKLACEDVGRGKLAEVDKIVDQIEYMLYKADILSGKKVLVTAGPTIEDIDPVRYITNRSTGKMGYALAYQAAIYGAEVTLVSGKTQLKPPEGISKFISVRSAQDMYEAVIDSFDAQDIVIKSAAVADYTPALFSEHKMKKSDEDLAIKLSRTKDILKELGKKKTHQLLVGFAAETDDIENYALRKLKEKNLDMIAANNVSDKKIGFSSDNNAIILFTRNGSKIPLKLKSKQEIAKEILNVLIDEFIKN